MHIDTAVHMYARNIVAGDDSRRKSQELGGDRRWWSRGGGETVHCVWKKYLLLRACTVLLELN